MASNDSSPPDAKRLRRSPPSPSSSSPDHLLVDEILTRLPIAAAVRLPAVSRDWNAALTSDYFILAHRARAAAARRHPELLFFAPPEPRKTSSTTTFYACSLRGGEAPAAARELLTIDYFSAKHAVTSPTPCRGLTLVSDGREPRYHLLNLSTGDHVTLPPCQPAAELHSEPIARVLPGGITSYLPSMSPWDPFELSTTGLGFDAATGEHKVVRLFKERNGEHVCEVYTLGKPGGWRPCTGRVPASAANFLPGLPPVFVNGYLYWLLQPAAPSDWQIRRILSFSVGAEQFGSVYMPPRLSSRMRHLTNLDGSLCAVFDNRVEG
uniref:F-box associated beta-propeller type 3 domain-containing protein n=1 Tax=Oryza glaberrima TaxID=4538 RepID=I1PRX5_ORYGL